MCTQFPKYHHSSPLVINRFFSAAQILDMGNIFFHFLLSSFVCTCFNVFLLNSMQGHYNDPNCRFIRQNSGQKVYQFDMVVGQCGISFIDAGLTSGGMAYVEGTLVAILGMMKFTYLTRLI